MSETTKYYVTRVAAGLLLAGAFYVVVSIIPTSSPQPSQGTSIGGGSSQDVTLEGTIDTVISDDFTRKTASMEQVLTTAEGEQFTLHFANGIPPTLEPGTKVRIHGKKTDSGVTVYLSDSNNLQTITIAPTKTRDGVGTKKIALILLNFQNDTSKPFTKNYARTLVFTGSGSDNAYYKEISFGIMGLGGAKRSDGDIYGWYTVPYDNNPCYYGYWTTAAKNAAAADGFAASNYDDVVYAWPVTSACPWQGSSNLNGKNVWINTSWIDGSTLAMKVVGHELGHNYGLYHANTYDCYDQTGQRVPISANCTSTEYADPFDIMDGHPYFSINHMSGYNKAVMGWLTSANKQNVTSGGTYVLAPVESASSGILSLRITKDSFSNYYYLEYRQPKGFDNFAPTDPVVNGVSIRVGQSYGNPGKTYLLDTTPATTSFLDAALGVGQTFTDTVAGVTVTTVSVSPTSATVNISIPAKAK